MSANPEVKTHPILDGLSNALICLYFFCAPWGSYALFPADNSAMIDGTLPEFPYLFTIFFSSNSIAQYIIIMFIPLAILRLSLTRKWPIPLELSWPLILLSAVSLLSSFAFIYQQFSPEYSFLSFALPYTSAGISSILLLLCVPHWKTVRDSLWLFAFSGACICIVSMLSLFRLIVPIAWPTAANHGMIALLPSQSLLLLCSTASLLIAFTRVSPRWIRFSAMIFAIPSLMLLVFKISEAPISFSVHRNLGLTSFLFLALVYWFVARVFAKAWLRQHELKNSISEIKKHRSMLLGTAIAFLILFIASSFTRNFQNFNVLDFFLPLLIAYIVHLDRLEELHSPAPRKLLTVCLLIPCAVLLIYNVFNISPNIFDMRNYQGMTRYFTQGNFSYFRQELQSINQLYPGERNTWYWIAQSRLSSGDADGSVEYYLKSLEPGNPIIIKDYPQAMKDKYLKELREFPAAFEKQNAAYDENMATPSSKPITISADAQNKTGLPYERVLLATGDTAAAMTLLQAKADTQPAATTPYSREAMLWGLGRILNRSDAPTLFADWPDEKLYALLRQQAIIERSAESKSVLSLIVQEDLVTFEHWQNGSAIGGVFPTPNDAWFKEKAIKRLTSDSITFISDTITAPFFTITLGDTPSITFQPKIFPPGKVANGTHRPFTHRFVLFAQ